MSTVKISKLQMLVTKFDNIRMHENQTFLFIYFYLKLSDIINFSFNLGEPIPDSKVVRKILRSISERFRPKVTIIEERKDINSIRVDELVGSIQTYEMTLPSSQKPKNFAFKASKDEVKDSEMQYDITHDELAHMVKRIKRVMKFNKRFYKNQEYGKGKRHNELSSNEKRKSSSKGNKFECFNCGGLGHYA